MAVGQFVPGAGDLPLLKVHHLFYRRRDFCIYHSNELIYFS